MANEESRQWLYNKLTSDGYKVGADYDEFASLMDNNEESRRWCYDTAQSLGLNVGADYDEFCSLVSNPSSGADNQAAGPQANDQAKAYDQMMDNLNALDANLKADSRAKGNAAKAAKPVAAVDQAKPVAAVDTAAVATPTKPVEPSNPVADTKEGIAQRSYQDIAENLVALDANLEADAAKAEYEKKNRPQGVAVQTRPMPNYGAMLQAQGDAFRASVDNKKKAQLHPMGEYKFNAGTGNLEKSYYTRGGDEVSTATEATFANADYEKWRVAAERRQEAVSRLAKGLGVDEAEAERQWEEVTANMSKDASPFVDWAVGSLLNAAGADAAAEVERVREGNKWNPTYNSTGTVARATMKHMSPKRIADQIMELVPEGYFADAMRAAGEKMRKTANPQYLRDCARKAALVKQGKAVAEPLAAGKAASMVANINRTYKEAGISLPQTETVAWGDYMVGLAHPEYATMSDDDIVSSQVQEAQAKAAQEQMANLQQGVHQSLVKAMFPESDAMHILECMTLDHPVGKLLLGMESAAVGDGSYAEAFSEHHQQYGAEHWLANTVGFVGQMATDPLLRGAGKVGSKVGESALMVGGRLLSGTGRAAAGAQMMARAAQANSVGARMLSATASQATTFGLWGAGGNLADQFATGGRYNPETGKYEYDLGEVGSTFVHEAGKGALMGVVGTSVGAAGEAGSRWLHGNLGRLGRPLGAAATALGKISAFGSEAWVFMEDNAEGVAEGDPGYKTWLERYGESLAFLGVIKGMHGAGKVGTAVATGHVGKMAKEMARRLTEPPQAMGLSKAERQELKDNGYGDLWTMLGRWSEAQEKGEPQGPEALETLGHAIGDWRLTQELRGKLMWYADGRGTAAPTVGGARIVEEGGRWTVEALDDLGEVVSRTEYGEQSQAKESYESLLDLADRGAITRATIGFESSHQGGQAFTEGLSRLEEGERASAFEALHKQGGLTPREVSALEKLFNAEGEYMADQRKQLLADFAASRGVEVSDVEAAIKKRRKERNAEETALADGWRECIYDAWQQSSRPRAVESMHWEQGDDGSINLEARDADGKAIYQVSFKDGGGAAAVALKSFMERFPSQHMEAAGVAELFDGRTVDVLTPIAVDADGVVDKAKTVGTIVIRGADGKLEMVSPDFVKDYQANGAEVDAKTAAGKAGDVAPTAEEQGNAEVGAEVNAEQQLDVAAPDVTPDVNAADGGAVDKYRRGWIVLNDGGEAKDAYIVSRITEDNRADKQAPADAVGKYEVMVDNEIRYLSEEDLDNIGSGFKGDEPERRVEPQADAGPRAEEAAAPDEQRAAEEQVADDNLEVPPLPAADNQSRPDAQAVPDVQAAPVEPMPMVKDKKGNDTGEPDFYAVPPERTYGFLYSEEGGLTADEANALVLNTLRGLKEKLGKMESEEMQPKMGNSYSQFVSAKARYKAELEKLRDQVKYWESVVEMRAGEMRADAKRQGEEQPNAANQEEAPAAANAEVQPDSQPKPNAEGDVAAEDAAPAAVPVAPAATPTPTPTEAPAPKKIGGAVETHNETQPTNNGNAGGMPGGVAAGASGGADIGAGGVPGAAGGAGRGRYKPGFRRTEQSRGLDQRGVDLLETLGRQLNITIEFASSDELSANGSYSAKNRLLRLSERYVGSAEDAVLGVLGHELTHAIKSMSSEDPGLWDAYKQVVKAYMGDELFGRYMNGYRQKYDAYIDRLRGEGRDIERLSDADIEEEVLAEMGGELLAADPSRIRAMIDRVSSEGGSPKAVVERIKKAIGDMMEKLRALLRDNPDLRGAMKPLEDAYQAWESMYEYAAAKEREATDKAVAEAKADLKANGGEKYSLGGDAKMEQEERGVMRVEMNVASAKDAESRAYIQEIMTKHGFGETESKDLLGYIDAVAAEVTRIAKKNPQVREWELRPVARRPGKVAMVPKQSAFVNNGDYDLNVDMGTLCPKRESLDRLMQIIVDEGMGQNLGPTQIAALRDLLKKYGYAVQCNCCFVESKRARALNQANDLAWYWNAVCDAVGVGKDAAPFGKGKLSDGQRAALQAIADGDMSAISESVKRRYDERGRALDFGLTESGAKRVAKIMLEDERMVGHLDPARTLTTRDLDNLLKDFSHTSFPNYVASFQGAATAKPLRGYRTYDPLSWREKYDDGYASLTPQEKVAMVLGIGGVRAQSFTDFNPLLFFDYVQMFADLHARRLSMHTYTKVPSFVELFGETGAMINMSLFPSVDRSLPREFAGLTRDADGNLQYIWADESFPPAKAFELRTRKAYGGRVGTIAVGLSPHHIRMLLDDPNIDQVIPVHIGDMEPNVKVTTGLDHAIDYKDYQETKCHTEEAKAIVGKWSFNEAIQRLGDPRAAANEYLSLCKQCGAQPKFPMFAEHPNYYKLLADFRCIGEEGKPVLQGAVKLKLPSNFNDIWGAAMKERDYISKELDSMADDEAMLAEARKIVEPQRIDGEVRKMFMSKLSNVLGKKNVKSLEQGDFDQELDQAYQASGLSAEESRARIQTLRDSNGIVYGFATGRKICLNESYFNANTPAHEYGHIWAKVVKASNSALWDKGKALLKEDAAKDWQSVLDDELYRDIHGDEDAVASEVLARILGGLNEERINELLKGGQKRLQKAGITERVLAWLKEVWGTIRDTFGGDLDGLTFEEFVNMPMRDLYDPAAGSRFRRKANKAFGRDGQVEPKLKTEGGTVEHSIIGEQGARMLDERDGETTRMDNLDVAKDMERGGKDALKVKLATGWERGADGKWRYEMADGKLKDDVSADWAAFFLGEPVMLTDVWDAPELFKAYPKLNDIKFKVAFDYEGSGNAGYTPRTRTIYIDADLIRDRDNETIAHEIQHVIQGLEGFAQGGNTKKAQSYIDKENAKIDKKVAALKERANAGKISQEEALAQIDELNKQRERLQDDFGIYKRFSGEVESRNVQSRYGMSDEERRAKLLAETEDVAREDQLFINKHGKFFVPSGDEKFSIIGEGGARLLDESREATTMLDNLGAARDMEREDKDARAIKMATGWERGADGKWRHELPDGAVKGDIIRDIRGESEIADDVSMWDGRLGEAVDGYDELLKAYPELADIHTELYWSPEHEGAAEGEYMPGLGRIRVMAYDEESMRSALAHEIQHAIQDREGFAQGGMPYGDMDSYRRLGGEVESRNVQRRLGMSGEERRASLLSDTEDYGREEQSMVFDGEGAMGYISKKVRAEAERLLEKRQPDMPREWKDEAMDYLHSLEDTKENNRKVRVALKWLADGKIRLPQDISKVDEALKLADDKHVDPFRYASPADLMLDNLVLQASDKKLDPDDFPELSGKRVDKESGCVVYDVEDTEAGQQAVIDLLRSHLGVKDDGTLIESPWCLSTFTNTGKATNSARRHWFETYTKTSKQIAFKDGKPFAFSANDQKKRVWWDFYDRVKYTSLKDCQWRHGFYGEQFVTRDYEQGGVKTQVRIFPNGDKRLASREYEKDGRRVTEKYYLNGNLESRSGYNKDGEKDGVYESYTKDGQPRYRVEYKDGKFNGVFEHYYEGGQLESRKEYKNGIPDGVYENYWTNGHLATREEYKDGKRQGVSEYYYEDGQLRSRAEYKDGEKHGVCEDYYGDGQLKSRAEYKDGEQYGVYESYGMNGQLRERTEYKDGSGVSESYYENGQLERRVEYKDGKQHGVSESYYENGQLEHREEYKDGKQHGVVEGYYENGQLKHRVEYKDDRLHGVGEVYYEGGQLKLREEYEYGKEHGVHESYYLDGKLCSRMEYKDGKRHGVHESYYLDGKLCSRMEYKDGKRHGVGEVYTEDGTLLSRDLYENDRPVEHDYDGPRTMVAKWEREAGGDDTKFRILGEAPRMLVKESRGADGERKFEIGQDPEWSEEGDRELIERLERGPKKKLLAAMVLIDGELYPPMSSKMDGKLRAPSKVGKWEESEERPDKIKAFREEDGREVGTFTLKKDNNDTVGAAFNPYFHQSDWGLNDQFSSAWDRDNLVVVEVEIPESELTSGYRARYAKDAVGLADWRDGGLTKSIGGRNVYLSRWRKPVRILDNAEVARLIAPRLRDNGVSVPFNTVPPGLREALVREGVKIGAPENGNAGDRSQPAWREWRKTLLGERGVEGKRLCGEAVGRGLNVAVRMLDGGKGGNGGRAGKAWYDQRSGEVVVDAARCRDAGEVSAAVLHAAVGSQGLREVVGERGYGQFLRGIYDQAGRGVRRQIASLMGGQGWNLEQAAHEYLTRLGTKPFEDFDANERAAWELVKSRVSDIAGVGGMVPRWATIGDNELRHMLWRSGEGMRRGEEGAIGVARDLTKRRELGLVDDEKFSVADADKSIWEDGSLSMSERVMAVRLRMTAREDDAWQRKEEAVETVASGLRSLVHDMRNKGGITTHFVGADQKVDRGVGRVADLQRRYDAGVSKRAADLARVLMQTGYLSNLGQAETARLMAAVRDASAGQEGSSDAADRIISLMVDHQVRVSHNLLAQAAKGPRRPRVDSRGIMTGGDNAAGVKFADALREGMKGSKQALTARRDQVNDRLAVLDPVANKDAYDLAVSELQGLELARRYHEDIIDSRDEESLLKEQIEQARADLQARYPGKKLSQMPADEVRNYRETVAAIEDKILEERISRVEASYSLAAAIGDENAAAAKRAEEFAKGKAERANQVRHNLNSDMQGMDARMHHGRRTTRDTIVNFLAETVTNPLATFEQMLSGITGTKAADGHGYTYERFIRGLNAAREREISGYRGKREELDAKVAELFGKKKNGWQWLMRRAKKRKTAVTVSVWDKSAGEFVPLKLNAGQQMYVYMVDKMTDGRMKLRQMGIDEDTVEAIRQRLDPKLVELADWIQDDFLTGTRDEYNKTHRRMYGADMAAIEHYFPLKILGDARHVEETVDEGDTVDTAAVTITGALKKRVTNSLSLDLENADALSVVLDHLAEMEHWNAFAELGEDMNTVLSYGRFKNQVKNMHTIYGNGEPLWKRFKECSRIAFGTYRPEVSGLEKAALKGATGVTAACVGFRVHTAAKQLLSLPAVLPEMDVRGIAEALWSTKHTDTRNPFVWCMNNLPVFKERWAGRMSGDPRTRQSAGGWEDWRGNVMEMAVRYGMTPNAFVDAVTCSIVAYTTYVSRLSQYKRDGYSHAQADARAKSDASIAFNLSQQSQEGAYLSPLQAGKGWVNTLFKLFRNSPMSYTRQVLDSGRNLTRMCSAQRREDSLRFMQKQILRDWGVAPDEASQEDLDKSSRAAKRRLRRSIVRDILRQVTFGYILPGLWTAGGYALYGIFGNDDEKKNVMLSDMAARTVLPQVEGLAGGDLIANSIAATINGTWDTNTLTKEMPVMQNFETALRKIVKGDNRIDGWMDLACLGMTTLTAVDIRTFNNALSGIIEACGHDPKMSHEALIMIARIMNAPESQVKELYFDELAMTGDKASQLSPRQIAERYAEAQVMRGRPVVSWWWRDAEAIQKKMEGQHGTLARAKARVPKYIDDELEAQMAGYQELEDRRSALIGMTHKPKDYWVQLAKVQSGLNRDLEGVQRWEAYKACRAAIKAWAKRALEADSYAEYQQWQERMRQASERVYGAVRDGSAEDVEAAAEWLREQQSAVKAEDWSDVEDYDGE